jgi:hypothetical protein
MAIRSAFMSVAPCSELVVPGTESAVNASAAYTVNFQRSPVNKVFLKYPLIQSPPTSTIS